MGEKKHKITLERWLQRGDYSESEPNVVQEREEEKKGQAEERNGGHISELIREFKLRVRLPPIRDNNVYIPLEKILNQIGPRKILAVTEKPSVAKAFASALSPNKRAKVTKFGKILVYKVNFKGLEVVFVPLLGHITEIATAKPFSGDWSRIDPIKIIEDEKALIEKIKNKEIANILSREAKDSDLLLIATDADEEGANIGYEAYKIVRSVKEEIPVYQLWFLSVDPAELRKAFSKPIIPKWRWAEAVEARRYIDAFVGFSSTRELTLYLTDSIKHLGRKVASLGRVQTPTLYLIYLREKEIKDFKPEPYWSIKADVLVTGKVLKFLHIDSPFRDKGVAERIFEKVRDCREGIVVEISVDEKKQLPPTPLNTTKALSEMNKHLGISSHEALRLLEDLYLLGLITYPRTDTDKYPEGYNHEKNLRELRSIELFRELIDKKILSGDVKLKRNGRNMVGDHLPITPIKAPDITTERRLSEKHKKVYEFVVRRYLALFFDPAILEKTYLKIEIGGEPFHTKLTGIKVNGFFEVYPYDKPKDVTIGSLKGGDVLIVKNISLEEGQTKPPKPITEYELIKLMEKLGLGTKSTRAEHIQKLVDRNYIRREGKNLRITELGWSLATHLEKTWPDFVKPYFSAYVHKLMRGIMNGEREKNEVIDVVRKKFLNLFALFRRSLNERGHRIVSAVKDEIAARELIKCPKCNSPMINFKDLKRSISVRCVKCGFEIFLPKFKSIESVESETKCAICGGGVYVLVRKRRIYFCPNCLKKVGFCYNCEKKNMCDVGALMEKEEAKRVVGKCENCGGDVIFVPERRMVFCKKCKTPSKFKLPRKGRINLLKKVHDACGWRLFSVSSDGNRYRLCLKCGNKF